MEKRKFDGSSADFKELIGCVIDEVYLNNNRDEVYFKVGHDSWLKYSAHGDCCSNSWFEIVDVPSEKPMKVFEVLEREMPEDLWGSGKHECVAFYGWSIVTNQGYLDIEMRNSSNGYYGGSVRFCGKLSPELDKKKKEEEIKKKEEDKFTLLRSIFTKMIRTKQYIDFKVMVGVVSPANIIRLREEIQKNAVDLEISLYKDSDKFNVFQFYNHSGKAIIVEDTSKTDDEIDFMIPLNKVSHFFPYGDKQ